ncbi:MAG: hypothetical protein AB7E55_29185, partial [Pigmentiphaga sp.]
MSEAFAPHLGKQSGGGHSGAFFRNLLEGKAGSAEAMRRFRSMFSDKVCIGQADDDWRCANKPGYEAG